MDENAENVSGQCHCGGVRFEARLSGGFGKALRCTCSICSMHGAVMVFAGIDRFRIISGEDLLSSYRFNTNAAQHFFCSRCGIYTHHQRRFDPSQYAINAACLDGVSPYDFAEVPVIDGAHHPLDGDGKLHVIGTMRFAPSDQE